MKNKYSLLRILKEAWGEGPYGEIPYGQATSDVVAAGIAAAAIGGSAGIDGYTYPLGLPAGYGYDRPNRIFTAVNSYKNDFSGEFADYRDNKRAKGFPLNGDTIKSTGKTFGAKSPGNTFTGPYATYKSPVTKMVRDYGLSSRRLTDILPADPKKSGIFDKYYKPKTLGNAYKDFGVAK